MRPNLRLLAATSLAYPILTVIAFAAFPKPPGGDVSAAHDPSWLAAHTGAVIAQGYLRSLAALGFLLLAVALSAGAGPVVSRLIVASGAGTTLLLLTAQGFVLAAAYGVRDGIAQSVIRVLDPLNAAALDLSSLPAIVLFAAAGAALLARVEGPRSLGWLTVLGVPLALLDALSYRGGPLASVGAVGLAYFLVWSLACGLVLVRHPAADGPTPATNPDLGRRADKPQSVQATR
ncbi:hypothetical protein [uncultured Jatrophihabitans sp.]|uniref:hypothetical protein n=1 Tax=uncultured Jatrophihabitans sp. TaxID=1610747 RepID=UPI0035CBD08C